jgi:hypothetical protein
MARSANRPLTLFNAVTLHGKFTFNSSQLTIKLIDIYNFCNVICFLKNRVIWQCLAATTSASSSGLWTVRTSQDANPGHN